MEECGWLQGCLFGKTFIETIGAENYHIPSGDGVWLIAASQSCDIANGNEENIEFSIARNIEQVDGNFTFNKNPRKLHLNADVDSDLNYKNNTLALELLVHEKILIPKNSIPPAIHPEQMVRLDSDVCSSYVDWLSARYKRPALPTEFNNRIQVNALKKIITKAKVTENILGIYVSVYPDCEIASDAIYTVRLLALIKQDVKGDSEKLNKIQTLLNDYKQTMEDNAITVATVLIKTESEISVASFKEFKRFILDDLSYRSNDEQPPEKNFI